MIPFSYPKNRSGATARIHRPQGYKNYGAFKPWLRDEFIFRCAYCLTRERWHDNGHSLFGVDHFQPQSLFAAGRLDYDNLVYACNRCNSVKSDALLPLHPERDSLSEHIEIQKDGRFAPRNGCPRGREFIKILRLNETPRIAYRRKLMDMAEWLKTEENADKRSGLLSWFSFPTDEEMPDLARFTPPGGNQSHSSHRKCFHALRQRRRLPRHYFNQGGRLTNASLLGKSGSD